MSTAEFQRLTLIAAGVDPSQIPPVLDTATWRRLLISAIANSGGGGGGGSPSGPAGGDLAGTYPNPTIKQSVALTGTPTAPTAAAGTNTTQIATTEFVETAIQTLTARATNGDTVPLTRGMVVYASGAQGDKLEVKRADNTSAATSGTTIGIVAQNSIAQNAEGTIIISGSLSGLSLGSPYQEGDKLWLSTGGAFTRTEPTAPNHRVLVGIVERANNGNGIAFVRIQTGVDLTDLCDVEITTPAAGQIVVRNSANTFWINAEPALTTIGGHHTTGLNPAAGGQTYYFGYPHDGAAVTSPTERGFRFPYAGIIKAANATVSVGGSVGSGPGTGSDIGIYNKTTNVFSSFSLGTISYGAAQSSYRSDGLAIAVNTTDEYAFYVVVPSHSAAPTSTRHYANLFFARS